MAPRGILIVDDEPMLRFIACEVAADAGYEPMTAETGADALRIIVERADHLAAVVTDIRMPGEIDGLDLAARVRANWPMVRVVITSGSPFDLPEGCTALLKPYRPADLENALGAVATMPPLLSSGLSDHPANSFGAPR